MTKFLTAIFTALALFTLVACDASSSMGGGPIVMTEGGGGY